MSAFWKKLPPGWRLYEDDEWKPDDEGDGDGGGDSGGDGGGDDGDSGGDGGDGGGDSGGDGGGIDFGSGSDSGGDFSGGDSSGGDFSSSDNSGGDFSGGDSNEIDGDGGDDNAPMREFARYEREQEADRERERIQRDLEEAKQREEAERKRREAEAEAARQRDIAAELARQQAQQGPGEQPLPGVISPAAGPPYTLPAPQQQGLPASLFTPTPGSAERNSYTGTQAEAEATGQRVPYTGNINPPERQQDVATIAAQAAAQAAANAGGTPEQIAQTAEAAARMASDRQSLDQQSSWTRAVFRSTYGDRADTEWVRQHEAELARNQQLYGSREPTAGAQPLQGAPTGTPVAPDRRIDVVPPPNQVQPVASGTTAPATAAQPGGFTPLPGQAPTLPPGRYPNAGDLPTGQPIGQGARSPVIPSAGPNAGDLPTGQQIGQGARSPQVSPTTLTPQIAGQVAQQIVGAVRAPQVPTPSPYGAGIDSPPEGGYAQYRPQSRAEQLARDPGETISSDLCADVQLYPSDTAESPSYSTRQARGEETLPGRFIPERNTVQTDAQGNPIEPTLREAGYSPASATDTTVQAPPVTPDELVTTTRPLDTLAMLALRGRGTLATPEQIEGDAYHVAQGIAAMIQGKPDIRWPEPYLNDVARMAWARQEAQQGRQADPRVAPVDYIEQWKDAFYGRDERVPLVKELNQQMIDYAADTSRPGGPFNWKEVYGANGDKGLILPQATAVDCGPDAFSTIMRSRGYNVAPRDMFDYVRTFGNRYHTGLTGEFQGPAAMVDLVNRQAGMEAEQVGLNDKGWAAVDAELAARRPVMLSGPGHWWAVSAKSPDGKYYAGATGLGVTRDGWMQRGQFNYGGAPNAAVLVRGEANPDAPIVKQLGLKSPSNAVRDTRQFLSPSQYQTPAERGTARIEQGFQQQRLNDSEGSGGASPSLAPPDAAVKPRYTGDEAVRMRQDIMQNMPDFQFDPNDGVEDRMAKMVPALDWLRQRYGVDDAALAGMAYNENHVGMANSGAVRGNNLWSIQYTPQDPLASGTIPEGRWAQYPSVKAALARFVAMYAHPDNGYRATWQNRGTTDGFLEGLKQDKYIVDEPGPGNSVGEWRRGVQRGVDLYNQVKGGTVRTRENPAVGRGT